MTAVCTVLAQRSAVIDRRYRRRTCANKRGTSPGDSVARAARRCRAARDRWDAAGGVFVEKNSKAVACLRANLAAVCKSLGRAERDAATILPLDVVSAPLAAQPTPDLVFVDPPYAIIEEIAPALFARLTELLKAKDDPIIVFEMPGGLTLAPPGWTCVKRLGKGAHQPTVCFFKKAPAGP